VEVGVDSVALVSIFARKRVLGEVADQRILIKNSSEATEEGPHAKLGHTLAIFEGVAQVEDLAVVALVSVVAEVTALAVETEVDIAHNGGGVGGKLEEVRAGVPAYAGHGHGARYQHGCSEDDALHTVEMEGIV